MRISTTKQELIELGACESSFEIFVNKHGDKEVLFSDCLKSNSLEDAFWFIAKINNKLSKKQQGDIRLLACDYVESVLHLFENKRPDDKRPRLAIQAARDFVAGKITHEAWAAASSGARASEWAAEWAAARASAGDDLEQKQKQMVMDVLLEWEK